MKKHLAAVFLAAALTHPASATTFPSLATIYVASGVFDDGSPDSAGTATAVSCSNVSGVTTSIRVLVLNQIGAIKASATFDNVIHGQSIRASTHRTLLGGEESLATGGVPNGVINVESLQSGVFCTFTVVPGAGTAAGFPLHAVRINPHPGAVE